MKHTLAALRAMLQQASQKKHSKKGFTLVELVIVIAILAIIAVIAIPTVTGVIQSANKSTDASNAQAVQVALKSCYAEVSAGTMKINATTGVKDESTPATADTLTVDAALKAEGLQNIAALNNNIKASSNHNFYYVGSGIIKASCDVPSGTTTSVTGNALVKTVLGDAVAQTPTAHS